MIKPNTFLIGSDKCGTTSLSAWLSNQNDVCVSTPKEPMYFTKAQAWIDGYEAYWNKHFRHWSGEKIIIDDSKQNLGVGLAAPRIRECCGDELNFIICIRNPIERAYSSWKHWNRMRPGREAMNFGEAIESNSPWFDLNWADSEWHYEQNTDPRGGPYRPTYLENGMYLKQYIKFSKHFDKSRFHFVVKEMMNDECEIINLANFLNIDSSDYMVPHLNKSSASIDQDYIRSDFRLQFDLMRSYFTEQIDMLSAITGHDLFEIWGWE